MSEPALVQIQLNRDAVISPAHKAIAVCAQLLPFTLEALKVADLDNPPRIEGAFFGLSLTQTVNVDDRRQFFQQWLIAKAIHEIARGVRLSLEEAAHYLWAFGLSTRIMTYGEFEQEREEIRVRANKLNFPDLLNEVNAGLTSPFEFSESYSSLQKARNCLEHQDGMVLQRHLDEGQTTMTLRLPEYQIWAMDSDPPVQITEQTRIEKGGRLAVRAGVRELSLKAGDRLAFSSAELQRTAMGCLVFVQDLVGKLPH